MPNSPNLHIETFEAGVYAVVIYSGTSSNAQQKRQQKMLLEWLEKKGYKALSSVMSATYNAPFTLPFLRRNEVMVAIEADRK